MVLSRACFAEADDAAERSEAADGAEDEEEDAIAVQQPHRKVEEKDIDAVIIEEEFFAGWSREEEEEYKQCVLPSQPMPRREMTAKAALVFGTGTGLGSCSRGRASSTTLKALHG